MGRRSVWVGAVWGMAVSAVMALEGEDKSLYRQGLREFRAGRFAEARDIFHPLTERNPEVKKLQRLLAQSHVKADAASRTRSVRVAAAAQARLLLETRRSLLDELHRRAPAVRVTAVDGGGTLFSFPADSLFREGGLAFSGAGEFALALVRDYIQTHRTVFVKVACDQAPDAQEEENRLTARRAMALATRLFRQAGLAPTQMRLAARPGHQPVFEIQSHTLPFEAVPAERDLEGVLLNAKKTILDVDRGEGVDLEVSILDPSGVRAWVVKIVRLADGAAVRTINGTSDVWVSIPWDGRDEANRTVPPGAYRAFLTVRPFSGVERTDSLGVTVQRKRSLGSDAPAALSPTSSKAPLARRWTHVIEFPFNSGEVSGAALVELRQLAMNLKAFPGERVVIEGFAERLETNARGLAKTRANKIVELLTTLHGISGERLVGKGRDPEGSGESARRAVAYFLGGGN